VFDKFTEWWTSLGLVKVCGVRSLLHAYFKQPLWRSSLGELIKHEIYYLYLHLILSLFSEKLLKYLYLNILKMSSQTFPPDFFRRWTGPSIHANQNNQTTTKNIVLVLCFVTVLCHIVNRSYMLNTIQHSYMIKVFLSINEEETKPCWNTQ